MSEKKSSSSLNPTSSPTSSPSSVNNPSQKTDNANTSKNGENVKKLGNSNITNKNETTKINASEKSKKKHEKTPQEVEKMLQELEKEKEEKKKRESHIKNVISNAQEVSGFNEEQYMSYQTVTNLSKGARWSDSVTQTYYGENFDWNLGYGQGIRKHVHQKRKNELQIARELGLPTSFGNPQATKKRKYY